MENIDYMLLVGVRVTELNFRPCGLYADITNLKLL